MNCILTTIVPIGDLRRDLSKLVEIRNQAIKNNVKVIFIVDNWDEESQRKEIRELNHGDSALVRILPFNGGNPGGARNLGLAESDTVWIHFCDSDDKPNLEEILSTINSSKKTDTDIIICNYLINSGKSDKTVKAVHTRNLIEVALNPGIWRWIIKRDITQGIEFPNNKLGEDQVYIARLLSKNPEICISNGPAIYTYCLDMFNSLTKEMNLESLRESIQAFEKIDFSSSRFILRIMVIVMYARLLMTLVSNVPERFKYRAKRINLVSVIKFFTFAKSTFIS